MVINNRQYIQDGLNRKQFAPVPSPLLFANSTERSSGNPLKGIGEDRHIKKRRILVVDDNPTNALVLAGLMEDRQLDITCVPDGDKAVQTCTSEKFDLIFMDLHMPIMDGLEATRRIRELEQEQDSPHTPIVAVTAYDDPSVENSCDAVGMDGFLSKPVNARTLDRFLDIWID